MEFLKKMIWHDIFGIYLGLPIEYSCNLGCLPTRIPNISEQKASFIWFLKNPQAVLLFKRPHNAPI